MVNLTQNKKINRNVGRLAPPASRGASQPTESADEYNNQNKIS